MGLGKTIEALALILARPSRDERRKTTLIVAPLALLRQWKREIETKVKSGHALNTLVYHGPSGRLLTTMDLLGYDIVLCTYGKLSAEYKMAFEQKKVHQLKLLHKNTVFHRVILDEAHNIKNMTAKASLAAAEIQATYRLCMTGTPFMNRASELYPLIRFLRILPYSIWDNFSEDIDRPILRWDGDVKANAMKKLQNLFRSITIRRTKDSTLDNQPILRLPPRQEVDAHTVFDDDQLAFYKALELRQRLRFNKYLKAGTVMQNYVYCLVLLLRLRQACDHPHLIKNHGIPQGTKLSACEMRALASQLEDDVVERLIMQEEIKCPLCPGADIMENPVIISPCGHCICPECYSMSMGVLRTESDGHDLAKIICPADGCETEILPNNVIMYSFFADVHMPGSDDDELVDDEQDESPVEKDEARVRESSAHPKEYTKNERAIAREYVDLGGFVEADDLHEDGYHGMSKFKMLDSGDVAAFRSFSQSERDESEEDYDFRSSRHKTSPWRGDHNELFVTQSPEPCPAPLAHLPNAEDPVPTSDGRQVEANKDFNSDAENIYEVRWGPQQNRQTVFESAAALPADQHSRCEPRTPQRQSSRCPKMERSVSPLISSIHTRLIGEGTANNPFTINEEDEEEEDLQIWNTADDDRHQALSSRHEQHADIMNIETYDGPSSPRIGRSWRKRGASPGESASISKKTRTYDFLKVPVGPRRRASVNMGPANDYFAPNERGVATAEAGNAQYYYLGEPRLEYEDNECYENEEGYERQETYRPYRHNGSYSDTLIPSIEGDRSLADMRRKQKRQKKQKKEKNQMKHKNKKTKKQKERAGDFISLGTLRFNATHSARAMDRYRRRLREEWVPSAKTDKILSLLREIRQQDPGAKTLVFSLWTSFLDMVEVPLEDDGRFAHTRYDGGMAADHRDAAVRRFMEDPGCRVMLLSLTAGNAGLNLTAASNVIICEPFWNPFTEDQAVDRAHRIGQTRAVTVYRILVTGTVEDRILDLQAKKRALVNAVLGEEGEATAGRLTVQQLRGLFGA